MRNHTICTRNLERYLLASFWYVSFIGLYALDKDGIISVYDGVVFLPVLFFNLLVLCWIIQEVRQDTGDEQVGGIIVGVLFFLWSLYVGFLAFLPTTYAIRFTPLFVLLVAFLCAALGHTAEESGGKVSTALKLCCLHCFTTYNITLQIVLIVLKLDDIIGWSWKYVFIPFWIDDCLVLALLIIFTIETAAGSHNTGENISCLVLGWMGVTPLIAMEVLMCVNDSDLPGDAPTLSATAIASPVLVSFALLAVLRMLDGVCMAAIACYRAWSGCKQRRMEQLARMRELNSRDVSQRGHFKDMHLKDRMMRKAQDTLRIGRLKGTPQASNQTGEGGVQGNKRVLGQGRHTGASAMGEGTKEGRSLLGGQGTNNASKLGFFGFGGGGGSSSSSSSSNNCFTPTPTAVSAADSSVEAGERADGVRSTGQAEGGQILAGASSGGGAKGDVGFIDIELGGGGGRGEGEGRGARENKQHGLPANEMLIAADLAVDLVTLAVDREANIEAQAFFVLICHQFESLVDRCASARSTSDLLRGLEGLHTLVRQHDFLHTAKYRQMLIDMARAKKEQAERAAEHDSNFDGDGPVCACAWSRQVARSFQAILREMTAVRSLLYNYFSLASAWRWAATHSGSRSFALGGASYNGNQNDGEDGGGGGDGAGDEAGGGGGGTDAGDATRAREEGIGRAAITGALDTTPSPSHVGGGARTEGDSADARRRL
jgi:hypothetical protein